MTPNDVERQANEAGQSMADLCRSAGIAPSTFSRWKNGKTEPTLSVYRKLVAALGRPSPQVAD